MGLLNLNLQCFSLKPSNLLLGMSGFFHYFSMTGTQNYKSRLCRIILKYKRPHQCYRMFLLWAKSLEKSHQKEQKWSLKALSWWHCPVPYLIVLFHSTSDYLFIESAESHTAQSSPAFPTPVHYNRRVHQSYFYPELKSRPISWQW